MKLFEGWTDQEKKDWLMQEPDDCDISAGGPPRFFMSVKYMVSIFALWAIRQSPYVMPDRLTSACEHFDKRLREEFKEHLKIKNDWIGGLTREQLDAGIKNIIVDEGGFPQTIAWNTKVKNLPACDPDTNKRDPDCDFIDIHALARNVYHDIWKEGWPGIDLDTYDVKEIKVKDPSCP